MKEGLYGESSRSLFEEFYQRVHPSNDVRIVDLEDTQRWARMWILRRDLRNLVVIRP